MAGQVLTDPRRQPSKEGVERAANKIAEILPATPLLPLEIAGRTIWCKAECLQPVGAFKIRGAWHRLSDLSAQDRHRGIVAFSSGNHAQGVAWAARRLGIAATIVMPTDAPQAKLENTKALGAKVITYDRMTENREAIAAQISAESGAVIVPSFDDPWIIEGQGSVALEAANQLAGMDGGVFDSVIACCGGGGLASGCALALPDADVVVAEPEGWDDMQQSLRQGAIVPVQPDPPPTSCDALQTLRVSELTFGILQQRGAIGVTVTEEEIHGAMRLAFERLHLVLEPGGAAALAAVLSGKLAFGRYPLVTLSGGNVDKAAFEKILRD
ncbi:MAG: threonine/serine dehydratase [Sphingorhabdus sp.]